MEPGSDGLAAPTAIVRWLDFEPEEGVRRLALVLLEQAVAARHRLEEPEDAEALHDFRVALRRLRSTLRSYRSVLETGGQGVGRKLSRRLGALARATGGGRDAEVARAWVAGVELPPSARAGRRFLVARLDDVMAREYAAIRDRIARSFERLEGRLRERLSTYRQEVRLDREISAARLGTTVADVLSDLARTLGDQLAAIEGPDDPASHRARITAKRVRYLLEPFSGEAAAVRSVVKKLKQLQELLGDLHDAHVLEDLLEETAAEVGAERARRSFRAALEAAAPDAAPEIAPRARALGPRLEPGLAALGRANRSRRDQRFARLERDWLGDGHRGARRFVRELSRVVAALAPEGSAVESRTAGAAVPDEAVES